MAAKPEGITVGDGTQGSPYEVHNYDEIKWCCEDADAIPVGQTATSDFVYLKLVDNIDCQEYDVDFLWSITCTHHVDFNLNSKTIKTFYIAANSCMFTQNAYAFCIYDGKILNVYGHWESGSWGLFNTTSSVTQSVRNISFSIDCTKLISVFYNGGSSTTAHIAKNCSFWLQGVHSTGTNNIDPLTRAAMNFTCCDFEVHMSEDVSIYSGTYFLVTGSIYTNCRFQGNVKWNVTAANQSFIASPVTLRNCVWAVNTTIVATSDQTCYFMQNTSTSCYGIYNIDLFTIPEVLTKLVIDRSNNYIECHNTDMDMRYNPNADTRLVELGFDVIKG
jgi:hypothetical protein